MHAQLTSAHAVQSLAVIPMPSVPFSHLSREELDVQFSPSRSAKDPWGVLRRHGDITSSLEHAPDLAVTRDLAYGARPSQCLDLVVPRGRGPHPCVAWFHGGFWQEGSKAGSGFAAHALVAHGIAARLADRVYVTSDNPRGEDPWAILLDIDRGIRRFREEVTFDPDRRRAIRSALDNARRGDVVLIAGKGHETYQDIAGVRRPFSDLAVASAALKRAAA